MGPNANWLALARDTSPRGRVEVLATLFLVQCHCLIDVRLHKLILLLTGPANALGRTLTGITNALDGLALTGPGLLRELSRSRIGHDLLTAVRCVALRITASRADVLLILDGLALVTRVEGQVAARLQVPSGLGRTRAALDGAACAAVARALPMTRHLLDEQLLGGRRACLNNLAVESLDKHRVCNSLGTPVLHLKLLDVPAGHSAACWALRGPVGAPAAAHGVAGDLEVDLLSHVVGQVDA